MQQERPGQLGGRAHVLACDDGFIMRTAVQVPFPTQEPLCSLSGGGGSGLGCRGSATRPGTVLEGTWRAEFTAGASPSCHVSGHDSQISGLAPGQVWGRASIGPSSEAHADVSPDVLPRASHAAECCQGKDKNAKPSPEPRG